MENWSSPLHDYFKMNVTVAINAETTLMGFGVIICNARGEIMTALAKNLGDLFSPKNVEARA